MELYTAIWVTLLGLVFGSFLNVLIHRLPRKQQVLLDRSRCPKCSSQLRWYHNIPLVSFLFLRGKCAFCGGRISYRYPLVETINAIGWFYFLWQFGLSQQFFVFAYLFSALVVIFFVDLDFQIIPDVITIPGMVLGLAVAFLPDGLGIGPAALGLLVGGGSLYGVALLGDLLFKKESMGGGDIKMAGMLGAFVGWQKVLLIFMSSAVIGLVVSVALMGFSSKLRKERLVPFGPFLVLAALLAIIYGDRLIALYVDNFLQVR